MPATSKKQERFMQAVANNPKFAKKAGVPQSVGREFTKDNTMKCGTKKMAMGGKMNYAKGGMPMVMKDGKKMPAFAADGKGKMAKGGGVERKGKTKGAMVKMAKGGSVSSRADGVAQRGKTNCKVG